MFHGIGHKINLNFSKNVHNFPKTGIMIWNWNKGSDGMYYKSILRIQDVELILLITNSIGDMKIEQ